MLAIVIGALIIGCAYASPIDPKIVGGWTAQANQFPHQVSLRSSNGAHFCSASIISTQWLLTAANCFPGPPPTDLIAVVGTNVLTIGMGTAYRISQVIRHSSYNPQTNLNDIAVLKVNGNIRYSGAVQGIGLANGAPPNGAALTLSGWGLTSYPSSQLSNDLQFVKLTSITVPQCQQLLPGYPVFNTHQCTITSPGKGACLGDSGSPLLHGTEQVGIVSWVVPCGKGNPDVFTSVASYREWIKAITGV